MTYGVPTIRHFTKVAINYSETNQDISKITLSYDNGQNIEKGSIRGGDKVNEFNFDKDKIFAGFWGFSTANKIQQLGVITQDTACTGKPAVMPMAMADDEEGLT